MNVGGYELAMKVFGQLVETKPTFAEGWNKRATVLYLLGRYRESVADITKVLALEPRHFGALSGLALCDEQLGKNADALQALRRTAAIYPNMPGLKARIEELTTKVEGEPT
jgi:tetratricopeptide (TPR) repeat protein